LVDSSFLNDRMLDMREFMDFMHCKRSAVYRWRKEGKIESVVVGRKILFRSKDVEHFLQENTTREPVPAREVLPCP